MLFLPQQASPLILAKPSLFQPTHQTRHLWIISRKHGNGSGYHITSAIWGLILGERSPCIPCGKMPFPSFRSE